MLTREEIYDLLVKSKIQYIQDEHKLWGMCHALDVICCKLFPQEVSSHSYSYLQKLIPEFNPKFLNSSETDIHSYWWFRDDKRSRLEAFDKLINLYEKKNE